ncbi:MAG: SPOR domain-containing protein [Bacteroidota bacterium]
MDIAYYISDLLGQQGELTVPNLGYFVQIRMAAYYDNQAKKFFPPHYAVQFDPQIIDEDESLAKYITGVKNISLASAKYFIEKYIANLKNQAMVDEVPFANLGSFNSDGVKLTFTSTTKMDDPAFFAFRPLDVYKINDTKSKKPVGKTDFLTTPPPVPIQAPVNAAAPHPVEAPVIAPAVAEPELAEEEVAEEEYYEEEPKRVFGIWMILLIVFTLIVIGLGAIYKFRPDLIKQYLPQHKDTTVVKHTSPIVHHDSTFTANQAADSIAKQQLAARNDSITKADSAKAAALKPNAKKAEAKKPEVVTEPKKTEVIKETKKATAVVVAPPVNTPTVNPTLTNGEMPAVIPKGWYVITAGAFPIKSIADKQMVNMKSRGFAQARYLNDKVGRGGNYIVILGAFATRKETTDGMKELKATGKIVDSEMSIREIR